MRRVPAVHALPCLGVAGVALFLASCSFGGFSSESALPAGGCVDDSPECIDRRGAALRSMMADKDRRWVKEPATPGSYASGVRLFAYKSRKRDLNCEELAHGKREADAAPFALRGPSAAGLSPAQVSRSSMLAAEVSKELAAEMKRRCRA
jgi:hypothetical protein